MPFAENNVEIARPISQVFAFLADGTNNPEWRPEVMDIKLASGSSGAQGAVYAQGAKGPFGRIASDYEITEIVPNSLIAFRVVAGPVRPEGKFEFKEENGKTVVHFALTWKPKGLKMLMGPMVQKTMNTEVMKLENLKGVLEGSASSQQ